MHFKQKHEQQFTKRNATAGEWKGFVLIQMHRRSSKKQKRNKISFQEILKETVYIYIQNVTRDIERRWSVRGGVTSSATSRHLESVVINVFQTQTRFLREQLSLAAVRPPIISDTQTGSRVEPKAELKQWTNMKRSHVGKKPGRNEKIK